MVYAPLAWLGAQFYGPIGIFAAAATANCVAGGLGVLQVRRAIRARVAEQQAKAGTPAAATA
jgi:hypothetical protein